MKGLFISVVLAIALVLVPFSGVLAAEFDEVTVTATPSFISVSNTPIDWSINGILGSGKIAKSTTYYTNPLGDTTSPSDPVVDGECRFTLDNTSSIATNITVNFPDFTGGDAMTNGNSGSAGVGSFGAYSYHSGMTTYDTDKVVAKSAASDALKSSLAADTDLLWGLEVATQTDDFSSGDEMSSTVTITATAV